jgi:hypothetical protein
MQEPVILNEKVINRLETGKEKVDEDIEIVTGVETVRSLMLS